MKSGIAKRKHLAGQHHFKYFRKINKNWLTGTQMQMQKLKNLKICSASFSFSLVVVYLPKNAFKVNSLIFADNKTE